MRLWGLAKGALAVLLLGLVVSRLNVDGVRAFWTGMALQWLVPSAAVYALLFGVTARRSWWLIGRALPLRRMLEIAAVQTGIGNLLATGAGSASYVGLLRARYGIEVRRGVTSLLAGRLGDLAVSWVALAVASAVVWSQVEPLHAGVRAVLAVAGGALLLVAIATFALVPGREPASARPGALRRVLWEGWLAVRIPRASCVPLLLQSATILGLTFAFGWCNMRLLGLQVGGWELLFVTAVTQLIGMIPVQVLGGLGISEATGVYLYGLFGVPDAIAAPAMLAGRVYLSLLSAALLAGASLSAGAPRAAVAEGGWRSRDASPRDAARAGSTRR